MSRPGLDIEQYIGGVVQALVKEQRILRADEGLHIGLDFSYSVDQKNKSRKLHKKLHFIFSMPGANYVRVFSTESKDHLLTPTDLQRLKWKQTAYHNSCWRSDGLRPHFNLHSNLTERLCRLTSCQPRDIDARVQLDGLSNVFGEVIAFHCEETKDRFKPKITFLDRPARDPLSMMQRPLSAENI